MVNQKPLRPTYHPRPFAALLLLLPILLNLAFVQPRPPLEQPPQFSPHFPIDENTLLFLSADFSLRLYNASTGMQLALTAPQSVSGFTLSPSKNIAACVDMNGGGFLLEIIRSPQDAIVTRITPLPAAPLSYQDPHRAVRQLHQTSFSPTGAYFTFRDNTGRVWVIDTYTRNSRQLPDAAGLPAWSSTNLWMAYVDTASHLQLSYMRQPNREVAQNIAPDTPLLWSPSLPHLAFATIGFTPPSGPESAITLVYDALKERISAPVYSAIPVSWSPDGALLALERKILEGGALRTWDTIIFEPFQSKKLIVNEFELPDVLDGGWAESFTEYVYDGYSFQGSLAEAHPLAPLPLAVAADATYFLDLQPWTNIGIHSQGDLFCTTRGTGLRTRLASLQTVYADQDGRPGIHAALAANSNWLVFTYTSQPASSNAAPRYMHFLTRCDASQQTDIFNTLPFEVADYTFSPGANFLAAHIQDDKAQYVGVFTLGGGSLPYPLSAAKGCPLYWMNEDEDREKTPTPGDTIFHRLTPPPPQSVLETMAAYQIATRQQPTSGLFALGWLILGAFIASAALILLYLLDRFVVRMLHIILYGGEDNYRRRRNYHDYTQPPADLYKNPAEPPEYFKKPKPPKTPPHKS